MMYRHGRAVIKPTYTVSFALRRQLRQTLARLYALQQTTHLHVSTRQGRSVAQTTSPDTV